MKEKTAISRLRCYFLVHDDGRPTPYLDEAANMAIKALEKQIPKKPVDISRVRDTEGYIGKVGKCPCCGNIAEEDEHHCNCGQKLDWSDER